MSGKIMRTVKDLASLQMMPLSAKIAKTQQNLREFIEHYGLDNVFISFSGGKDSTVLLDIARKMYPTIKGVFSDTGLEYPEIREFVKEHENIEWIKPKINFKQVILKYGYPFIGKEVANSVHGCKNQFAKLINNIKNNANEYLGFSSIKTMFSLYDCGGGYTKIY